MLRRLLPCLSCCLLLCLACDSPPPKEDAGGRRAPAASKCDGTLRRALAQGVDGLGPDGLRGLAACGEEGLGLASTALEHQDAELRRTAVEVLKGGGAFGARLLVASFLKGDPPRPELRPAAWSAALALSEVRQAEGRRQSAVLLGRLVEVDGEADPRGLKAVARLLEDEQSSVRQAALQVAAMLGPKAEALVDAVAHCLAMDAQESLRAQAADALGLMGASGRAKLKRMLAHEDPDVRRLSLAAVGRLGLGSAEMASLLTSRVKDRDPAIRRAAYDAILPLVGQAHLQTLLLQGLADESADVRMHVLRLLARVPSSPRLVDALRPLLKQGGPDEAELAARRLQAMGTDARSAYPDLIARALGSQEAQGAELSAARACLEAAQALETSTRRRARDLGRIFEKGRAVAVRVLAAELLGKLGSAGLPEEARLRKGMTDANAQIRAASLSAMLELRRDARAGST